MNTEEHTITKPNLEEKVKNPKRVAQGKRLAEISRAAKARKHADAQQESETSVFSQLPDLSTSMTMIGVATGVIGTYIAWKNLKQDQVEQSSPPTPTVPTPSSPKIKYNNLDDDDDI